MTEERNTIVISLSRAQMNVALTDFIKRYLTADLVFAFGDVLDVECNYRQSAPKEGGTRFIVDVTNSHKVHDAA